MKRILLTILTLFVVGCGKEQEVTEEKQLINKQEYYVGISSQVGEELKGLLKVLVQQFKCDRIS